MSQAPKPAEGDTAPPSPETARLSNKLIHLNSPVPAFISRPLKWTGLIVCLLVLLSCLGIMEPQMLIAGMLLVGWFSYLARVVPQVHLDWGGVLLAVGCAAGVLLLGHLLCRWLWRETGSKSEARRWPWRWTVTSAALIVLMFVSGIAAVGITHQSAWLARSDQLTYTRGWERAYQVKCGSNLRQIGQALMMYANDHKGRRPDSFAQLLVAQDITSEVFICPSSNSEKAPGADLAAQARELHKHCDYIYLGQGLTDKAPAERVIAFERLENHLGKGVNVLFADGHVEWLTPEEAATAVGGGREVKSARR